jgi:hypothetical protein
MTVLTLAAGLVVPGALVALTPSTAGAQGSDPLGPTIAQLGATIQSTLNAVELELTGPFGLESQVSCLLQGLGLSSPLAPCIT